MSVLNRQVWEFWDYIFFTFLLETAAVPIQPDLQIECVRFMIQMIGKFY